MSNQLIQINIGRALIGLPANKPPAGQNPYGNEPGNLFLDVTNSQPPELLVPDGMGGYTYLILGGGGGSITINTSAGSALTGGGTGTSFTLAYGFAGQQKGDLGIYTGAGWARFPVGTPGQVPTVNLDPIDPFVFWRDVLGEEPAHIDLVGGVNLTSRFGFAAQAAGSMTYAQGAYPTQWTELVIGTNGQRMTVVSGLPSWLNAGAEVNYDLYIAGTTGNDANDGLSPLTPVQTLHRLWQLVPDTCTGTCVMHAATGENITEIVSPVWITPNAKAPYGRTVTLDAIPVGVLPSQAISAGFQGFLVAFGFVTVAGPLTPNALLGKILHVQSGLAAGYYRIARNTATDIVICGSFSSLPLAGDLIEVIEESVTIELPAPTPGVQPLLGGPLGWTISGAIFDLAGNVFVDEAGLLLNASSIVDSVGGGLLVVPAKGSLQMAYAPIASATTIPIAQAALCGPYLDCDVLVTGGGGLGLQNYVQTKNVLVQTGSTAALQNGYWIIAANTQITTNSVGQFAAIVCDGTVGAGSAAIEFDGNCTGAISFCDFGLTVATSANAVGVFNGSQVQAIGLTSTAGLVGGPYGALTSAHCRLEVPDANTGSNVSGTLGDTLCGSNGAPDTWANIAASVPTACNDLASGFPVFSLIIP